MSPFVIINPRVRLEQAMFLLVEPFSKTLSNPWLRREKTWSTYSGFTMAKAGISGAKTPSNES